jgi:hypothetical protein
MRKKWIPVVFNVLFAAVSLFIYTFTHLNNLNSLIVLQIAVGSIIPFLIVLITDLLKIEFPMLLHMLIVFLIIGAIYFGNGLSFYSFVWNYDKILHTYFGFISSLIILCILIYFNGDKVSTPLLLFNVFFFTLGLGAVWEVFEFICDLITSGDSLGVNSSINNNLHPCTDIMLDLVVTMIGTCLLYIVLLIDKFNNFKLINTIKRKIDNENL